MILLGIQFWNCGELGICVATLWAGADGSRALMTQPEFDEPDVVPVTVDDLPDCLLVPWRRMNCKARAERWRRS